MLTWTNNNIVEYLQSQKDKLLTDWQRKVLISPNDPFKDRMKEYGEVLFYLLTQCLTNNRDELEKLIRSFSISIADQRSKAGMNIGDFVYNVNLSRSIFQESLYQMNLEPEELQNNIRNIQSCFDQFLFYSVSYYGDVKNQIIEEKTKFIDTSHKDRLTLLGQMTSSFIHEFRNPLTSVQGFIQLLKAENQNLKYLDIISIELDQLNFRISQFLLLSKKELIGKEKVYFSITEIIEEVFVFLYPSILDSKVKIIKQLNEEIHLWGYADEIRQVLINIIFNAIDVLQMDTTDPMIQITSHRIENSCMKLEISNNGPKIPQHLVQSIFEPFVTTKSLGTGLGLFVCKEIIEKHKGTLDCETQGDLTVFSITLPLADSNSIESDSVNI